MANGTLYQVSTGLTFKTYISKAFQVSRNITQTCRELRFVFLIFEISLTKSVLVKLAKQGFQRS